MSLDSTAKVPKKIWMLWFQGLDNAPHVVKECYASWKNLNPDWQVIFLDDTNLHEYVDMEDISKGGGVLQKQTLADIIRINLLAKYGGVWVDATCYCCRPLDDWLEEHAGSGFFAFDAPAKSRMMGNWFMASSRDCYLTLRLCEEVNRYWLVNQELSRRPKVAKFLKRLLNTNTYTTKFWFSYPVRRILKIYPYMWFQFLFAHLFHRDRKFRRIWEKTPKFSADLPHRLQNFGLLKPVTEDLKREIASGKSPLYKLTWKYRADDYEEGCVLHHLFQRGYVAPKHSPTALRHRVRTAQPTGRPQRARKTGHYQRRGRYRVVRASRRQPRS